MRGQGRSIAKRPGFEVVADPDPEPVQTERFENEEPDDEGPKEHLLDLEFGEEPSRRSVGDEREKPRESVDDPAEERDEESAHD